MKREIILKVILVLTIIFMMFAMSINVYAETTDLNDIFEDQGGLEDIGGETTPETPSTTPEPTPSTPSTGTTTGTTTQESTYSDAGLAEDTLMVVTIGGLILAAIFAYRKVNEYQNI